MKNKDKRKAGFTLIEIMIVLAILGLLFSFVGLNVIKQFGKSQKEATKIQIATYEQALQAYYLDNSMYPHTNQGMEALLEKPGVGREPKNYQEGGYLRKKKLADDPWGSPYRYECENYMDYTIYSNGPDAEPETDDDISSDD